MGEKVASKEVGWGNERGRLRPGIMSIFHRNKGACSKWEWDAED